MNPQLIQFLTALLPVMANILPGSMQNQSQLQQQGAQRELSASDFANNPKAFMARLSNMLGVTGAPSSAGPNSGGPNGAGTNTMAGMLKALTDKFTQGNSQALTNNVWQGEQAQLASSGMGQAPGVAQMGLSTALAPYQIQEQQLGATEGTGALQSALQTEETNLGYPFKIGEGAAGQFPSFSSF